MTSRHENEPDQAPWFVPSTAAGRAASRSRITLAERRPDSKRSAQRRLRTSLLLGVGALAGVVAGTYVSRALGGGAASSHSSAEPLSQRR